MNMVVEQARPEDEQAVLHLLERSHLPLEGLTNWLATTIVARENDGTSAAPAGDARA
jgi:hypothetical protein